MSDTAEPPPPPYDEAVRLRDTPSLSASDPLLGCTDEPSSRRRSELYYPGSSQSTRYVSDSPHSSDDEETSILKSELRRLREKDSNEQKKALLRQMIEEERQMIGEERAASGYTSAPHHWQPPSHQTYPGTVIHPMSSNIPGQSGVGTPGIQPYAAPLQCPTAIPGPSTTTPPIDSPEDESSSKGRSMVICCCFTVFPIAALVIILNVF